MAVDEKKYVEKAIQTLSHPLQHHGQGLQEHGLNHDQENSIVFQSDEENASVNPAYTYSESLYSSHDLESRSHRAPKPAQFPCNRPSKVQIHVKRVVSLPEAAALKSSSDNLSIPVHDGPTLRVVSLPGPELGNSPDLESFGSVQDNLSSVEYLDSSLDASYHSSGTGSVYHHNARSFPPSDMPTTPSPPSSPESVLVIGNESRISKAFLRQCRDSSTKMCDAEDEAGWITWASSPPRPIPALHGPLSLPYARCPSGAEGTIIEDADLPRMIWGLDLEDTQSNAVREVPSAKSPQPDTAIACLQASIPSHQATYESTRNLKPIHKQLDDKILDYKETRRDLEPPIVCDKPQPFSLAPESQHQAMHEVCPDKPRIWDDTPIDIHRLAPCDSYMRSKPAIDPLQHKKRSESTSITPAFVPTPPCQWSSPPMTPRIFIEPRPGSQITPGPRLSAMEIAQRYRAERQQSTLSSLQPSSPIWSPTVSLDFPTRPFSLDSTSSQSLSERDFASSFDSRAHTRSNNFSRRDIPADARQPEPTHLELNNVNIANVPSDYSDPSFSSRMNLLASVSSKDLFVQPSSALGTSRILKQLPPTTRISSRPQDIPSSNVSLQQPSAPQTRTRLLQGPRIQSIPMARLIQRRLSSVAEEDSSYHSPSRVPARVTKAPHDTGAITMDDVKASKAVETEGQGEQSGVHCENKENAAESIKGADKAAFRKKWRSRRKDNSNLNRNSQKK